VPRLELRYRLAWTVWPAALEAQDLRLRIGTADEEVRLAFEHARFRLGLGALMSRRLVLERLRGEGMSLRVVSTATGGSAPPAAAPPRRAWSLELEDACTTIDTMAIDRLTLIGPSRACGSVVIAPRGLSVRDARFEVDGALVLLNHELVGADLQGSLTATLPLETGVAALDRLDLEADVALKSVALEPLAEHLGLPLGLRGGRGSIRLVGKLHRGLPDRGSY